MVPGIEQSDVPGMTDEENSIDVANSSLISTNLKDSRIPNHHIGSYFGLPYQDHNYGAPPPPTPPSHSPCPSPIPSIPLPDEDTTLSVISNSTNEEIQEESITRCICGFQHDDEYMISCDNCLVWQHVDCMGLDRNNMPDNYLCDKCEPRKLDRQKAKLLQSRKKGSLTAVKPSTPTKQTLNFNNCISGKDGKKKQVGHADKWSSIHKPEFREALHNQRFNYSSDSDDATNRNAERRPKTRSKRRRKEEEKSFENSEQISRRKIKKHGKERMEAKRCKLRRGKNKESTSTADEEAQDAWEYSLDWCEKNFEDAINNQYTPEIQRLARTLNTQGFEKKFLEQIRTKQCHAYDDGKRKQLVCLRDLPRNSPLIEYKGKFLLASQFHDIHPLYNKRLYPYVLFYILDQDEICIDASIYGNDARFVRRSCRPNAEIRHMVYNGKLHLYLTSTRVIFREDEVTIPLIIHPNDNLKDFECACGTEECLVKPKKKNGTIENFHEKRHRTRRFTLTGDEDSNQSIDIKPPKHPTKTNHSLEKNKQIVIKDESKTTIKLEPKSPTKNESKSIIKHETKTAIKSEPKTIIKNETKATIKNELRTSTKNEPKSTTKNEPRTITKSEPRTTIKSELRTTTRNEARTTTRNEARTTTRNEARTTTRNEARTTTRNEARTTTRNEARTSTRNEPRSTTRNEFRSITRNESKTIIKNETITTKNELKTNTKNEPKVAEKIEPNETPISYVEDIQSSPVKEDPDLKNNTSDYELEEGSSCAKKKQTREERKIDAWIRAFNKMEEAEKRKKLALEKQKYHPKSETDDKSETESKKEEKSTSLNSAVNIKEEENPAPQTPKSKKGKRRRGSGTPSRRRTRTNSGGSDLMSLDEASPTKCAPSDDINAMVCSENNIPVSSPPPMSTSGLISPVPTTPSSPHILKTKRSLMNEWLQEKSEAIVSTPVSSPLPIHTEMKWNTSAAIATCYVRCTKDAPQSSGISAAHLRRSNSAGHMKQPSSGPASAKKRWLRQAINDCSETQLKYDPAMDNGCLSPNSHGDFDCLNGSGEDVQTPLKKRRLLRESIESMPSPQSPSTATSIEDTDATTVSNSLISDNSNEHVIDSMENEISFSEKEHIYHSSEETENSFCKIEDNNDLAENLIDKDLNVHTEIFFKPISSLEAVSNGYVETVSEKYGNILEKNTENEMTDESSKYSDLSESDSAEKVMCNNSLSMLYESMPESQNIFLGLEQSVSIKTIDSQNVITKNIKLKKNSVAEGQSQNAATTASSSVNSTALIKNDEPSPSTHAKYSSAITDFGLFDSIDQSPSSCNDSNSELKILSVQDENVTIFPSKIVKSVENKSPEGDLNERSPEIVHSVYIKETDSTNSSSADLFDQTMCNSVSSCNNVDNSDSRFSDQINDTSSKREETIEVVEEKYLDCSENLDSMELNERKLPGSFEKVNSMGVNKEKPADSSEKIKTMEVDLEEPSDFSEKIKMEVVLIKPTDSTEKIKTDVDLEKSAYSSEEIQTTEVDLEKSADTSKEIQTTEVDLEKPADSSEKVKSMEVDLETPADSSEKVKSMEVCLEKVKSMEVDLEQHADFSEKVKSMKVDFEISANSSEKVNSMETDFEKPSGSSEKIETVSVNKENGADFSKKIEIMDVEEKLKTIEETETVNPEIVETETVDSIRKTNKAVEQNLLPAINEETRTDVKACASATQKRKVSLSEYRMRMRENTSKIQSNLETPLKNPSPTSICAISLPDTLPEKVTLAPLPLFEKIRARKPLPKLPVPQIANKQNKSLKETEPDADVIEHRENLNERLKREFGFDVSEGITSVSPLKSTISSVSTSDILNLPGAHASTPPPPPPPRHLRPSQQETVSRTIPPTQFGFTTIPFPQPQFMVPQVPGTSYLPTQPPILPPTVQPMNTNSTQCNIRPPLVPSVHSFAPSVTMLRPPQHDFSPVNAQRFATLVQQPPPPPPHKSYLPVYPSGMYK